MSAYLAKIILVPGRRNTFPRRVRSRLIRARGNTLLTQLAHVPILFVSHVPKLNRVLRPEIFSAERVWMKKPIAHNQRPLWRLRPELMHHHIIGMQTQQHVRKDRVIKHSVFRFLSLFLFVCDSQGARVAAHGQATAFCDSHESTEKWTFAKIVLCGIVWRDFRKLRMNPGTVVTLRIIFKD